MAIAQAILQAQRMHREALEASYAGKCTVAILKSVTDPITKITSKQEIVEQKDIPCRLSFSSTSGTGEASPVAAVTQTIKLYLAPEIQIKPGSRITVTQNGYTNQYERSGQPAIYASHQEITLELFRGWA